MADMVAALVEYAAGADIDRQNETATKTGSVQIME